MSSSFITSNRLTQTLTAPPPRRRNNHLTTTARPSSFKCQLSSSDDNNDSSNSSILKTLSTTVVVSSAAAASAFFLTGSLHFPIANLPGLNGGVSGGGGVGGGSGGGGSSGGGGGWFSSGEGSFWSRILSPARAIADEPKSQDWDSHELPANITVLLGRLSGFKKYKISDIAFLDRSTKMKIGTEDSFLDMVSLKPGGVYTKAQLQKELESLATCGMFEKVDMEGKTNADGSLGLTISFAESMWEKADRFRCINVGLMGQSKPVEMDPDMSDKEKLEFFRRQEREYKRRIEAARPCLLPSSVHKEIRDMLGKQGRVSARLLPKMACLAAASSTTSLVFSSSSRSSRLLIRTLTLRPALSPPRLSFTTAVPLRSFMARATLGFTHPSIKETPKLSFTAKDTDAAEWKGDLLAVAVTEKDVARDGELRFQNPILSALDSKLGGLLADASFEEDFTGKVGQSTVLRIAAGIGSKRVALLGLGASASGPAAFKSLGEAVAAAAKSAQAVHVAVVLASSSQQLSSLNTASAIATGTVLGTFEDTRYKTELKKSSLKSVDIIGLGTGSEVEKKLKYAGDISSGILLGRELVNSPPNVLTPGVLAEEASTIASTYSDVFTAKILDAEQCEELKMGSYLAVAAASANPPHFIHLHYKPPTGPVNVKLALVGKGLTFDSGGYNIKTGPGCMIELMKFDMGGSAAVLGAAKALGQIKPLGVEVHFIVAACENMISGTGMRPGDILTASNGKTIEVNNTDAEGRLTLADALVYACNQGVDKIIDLATLTGACIIALGPSIAGAFTPSDELAKEVFDASEVSGEKLWRLPIEESYWESMKSGVADMVNTGGRQGGAITAALFLKQFVDEKVQWMHIDLAGPVWNEKQRCATGFGVSTLVEWVLKNAS